MAHATLHQHGGVLPEITFKTKAQPQKFRPIDIVSVRHLCSRCPIKVHALYSLNLEIKNEEQCFKFQTQCVCLFRTFVKLKAILFCFLHILKKHTFLFSNNQLGL